MCNIVLSLTAYEMTWSVHDDISPVPVTPNRSPISSVGDGCRGDAGERSSVSPDPASSPGGLTPVDCKPLAVTAAQLAATTASLHGASVVSTPDDSPLLAGVQCRLETKELWDKFYELGTEMIITKSGRSLMSAYHSNFSRSMTKTEV